MADYTQDQYDKALFAQREQDAVLAQINRRLDEANNYKATIGKDIAKLLKQSDEFTQVVVPQVRHHTSVISDLVSTLDSIKDAYLTKDEAQREYVSLAQVRQDAKEEGKTVQELARDKWLRLGVVATAIGIMCSVLINLMQDFHVLPHP